MSTTKRPGATATKKPPARDRSGALYAIVGDELLRELDAWAERLNARGVGPKWSRQDVVKAALARAVRERGASGEP